MRPMHSSKISIAYSIRDNPSLEDDLLLRFSLRSLDEFGKNFGRVFMLGKRRDWFSDRIEMMDVKGWSGNLTEERENNWRLWVFCHAGLPFVNLKYNHILVKDVDFSENIWLMNGVYNTRMRKAKNEEEVIMLKNIRSECGLNTVSRMFTTDAPFTVDLPLLMVRKIEQRVDRLYSFNQMYAKLRYIHNERYKRIIREATVEERLSLEDWRELIKKEKRNERLGVISVAPAAYDENFEMAMMGLFRDECRFEKQWIEKELGDMYCELLT